MYDQAEVCIFSGKGGSGVCSFEKIPFNANSRAIGGKGGDGGDVIAQTNENMRDLSNIANQGVGTENERYTVRAKNGNNGGMGGKVGKNGENITLSIPINTSLYGSDILAGGNDEKQNLKYIATLRENGETILLLKGGKGGNGNRLFSSSKNRSPLLAEAGEQGRFLKLYLSMNLDSDMVFIGYPNSGKSSIINSITGKRLKSEEYPFTTTVPEYATFGDTIRQYKLLELPAIDFEKDNLKEISDRYLRHFRYSKTIVFTLSSDLEFSLSDQVKGIKKALQKSGYKEREISEICVVNRQANHSITRQELQKLSQTFPLGCVDANFNSASDVGAVKQLLLNILQNPPKPSKNNPRQNVAELPVIKPLLREQINPVKITSDGYFEILHPRAVRLAEGSNLDNRQTLNQYRAMLENFGILRKFEDMGIKAGSVVKVGKWEFEWV